MTAHTHASPRASRAGLSRLGGALALALVVAGAQPALARDRNPAGKIEATLAHNDVARAIELGEAAVAANPRDAAVRSALGHAYLRAGRFASAEVVLADAVSLGDNAPRTALGLALAHIAAGHDRDAVAVLDQHRDAVPPADLGLALALAGETGRGVGVLADAVRGGDHSAKLRQNLAYAYALDGRWADARLAMAADVPTEQVDLRLGQWAQGMKSDAGRERVSALLGVPLAADPGLPARLALNDAPVRQLASAEPVRAPMPAPEAAPVAPSSPDLNAASSNFQPDDGRELPAVGQTAAAEPAPQPAPQAAPVQVAAADPAPQPVVEAVPAPAPAPRKPARHPVAHAARVAPRVASAVPAGAGGHVIQLGAFTTAANAQRAKAKFASADASLQGHELAITKVAVKGRTFWRVTAGGFDQGNAHSTCDALRASGSVCIAYAAGKVGVPVAAPARALAHAKAPAHPVVKPVVKTAHAAPAKAPAKPAGKGGALAMVNPVSGK